jgi:hypothetical protein
MSDGTHFITIPRHNPVNAITMGGIVKDAGLTITQFKELLCHGKSLRFRVGPGKLGTRLGIELMGSAT